MPLYFDEVLNVLVRREGLFPPCEMTYPIHENVHLVQQLEFTNLFVFERGNLYFKRNMKNARFPEASIARHYVADECNIFDTVMRSEVTHTSRIHRHLQWCTEGMRNVLGGLTSDLHIEEESLECGSSGDRKLVKEVLAYLPGIQVLGLYGKCTKQVIQHRHELTHLFAYLGLISVDDENLWGVLYRKFEAHIIAPLKGKRRPPVVTFYEYLEGLLQDDNYLVTIKQEFRKYVDSDALKCFDADVATLKRSVFNADFDIEFSAFNRAVVKGVHMEAIKNNKPLTFSDMFTNRTTAWCWGRDLLVDSFGCFQYFFRLNFTSTFQNFPMARVSPVPIAKVGIPRSKDVPYLTDYISPTNHLFVFNLTEDQYTKGPDRSPPVKFSVPKDGYMFFSLDTIVDTRWAMGRNPLNRLEIAFIAADPERLSDFTDPKCMYDGGDHLTSTWRNGDKKTLAENDSDEEGDDGSSSSDDDFIGDDDDDASSEQFMSNRVKDWASAFTEW